MNSIWDIRIFLGLVPKESHRINFISNTLVFVYLLPDLIGISYKGSKNLFRMYEFRENRRGVSHNFLTGVNTIMLTCAPWSLLHLAHKERLMNDIVLGRWDYRLLYVTLMALNVHSFCITVKGSSLRRSPFTYLPLLGIEYYFLFQYFDTDYDFLKFPWWCIFCIDASSVFIPRS